MFKKIISFVRKRWYVFILILSLVIFAGYRSQQNSAIVKGQKLYVVKRRDLKDVLTLSGEMNADEHAILRFQSSGRLAWVGVKEGDPVKKYQAIASLDQRDLKKRLAKSLNSYMDSRWDFDQSKADNEEDMTGAVTRALRDTAKRLIDQSQFDLNNAVIDVELQSLTLEYANLFTPIEGLVVRVSAPYAGVNITPAQAEFEIINPKTVYFSASADQTDVVNIKKDMKSTLSLDAYPDKPIKGTVSMISFIPKEGETGTVYEVKIALNADNTNYRYRLGMTGDADFVLRERTHVLVIPSTSIRREKGKTYVTKVNKEGKEVKTHIETTDEIDTYTIVTSGLTEGDRIYDYVR